MRFTVVLVTQPSRTGYLQESLVQLDRALSINKKMDLLVIFNGESETSQSLLGQLSISHKDRVRFSVVNRNSPLPNPIFSIIRNEGLAWIHMPGDDDLVIPESYSIFEKTLAEHPESVAVAFTALTIDDVGSRSEKILKPLNFGEISKEKALANAIHKPPFVWPSLIFDSRVLPQSLFASRFVFDWWVGMNLLLAGEIHMVNTPLVQYRIHSQQESARVLETRKRFEAEMMLQTVLFQETAWRLLHQEIDQEIFLSELDKKPPVYGDPGFGASIALLLSNSLKQKNPRSPRFSNEYLGDFAARHGVLMNLREFSRISLVDTKSPESFNFRLDAKEGTCVPVRRVLMDLLLPSGPVVGQVGCAHSDRKDQQEGLHLEVDCFMTNPEFSGISLKEVVFRQIESQVDMFHTTYNYNPFWEVRVLRILRKFLHLFRRARLHFLPN